MKNNKTNRPHKQLHSAALGLLLAALLTACSNQHQHPGLHESTNATLWSLTAPEFQAGAMQAYHGARQSLDIALAEPAWTAALEQQANYETLPPAVLMDIDQTILDNSLYNARIVSEYGEYTQETFSLWCEEEAATAIPGAREFIDHAVQRGVKVIYYSRRIESLRECTTNNLEALGLPVNQKHLLLNNKQPETKKDYIRTELSSQFRILLLVGDDLEDFVAESRTDPASRTALARQHADRWGKQWIILPNPMYGAWETSLYDHDYSLSRGERLYRKLQQLLD